MFRNASLFAAFALLPLLCAPPATAGVVSDMVHDMMDTVVGSGNVRTETRDLKGFDVIQSKGSIDLDVKLGPQFAVVVEADDNLFPVIRTEVSGGALVVDSKGSWTSHHATTVHVTLPRLTALGVQGSGDAKIHDFSGDRLGVKIQGSGDVSGTGRVQNLHVVIQGSGDADLYKLDADDVQVRVDGSGDAKVSAAKTLQATIHGSGDVIWHGDAPHVDAQVHGSGDVIRK
jgi:hypothetical protein